MAVYSVLFSNGLFTIARKFFVFTTEKYVCFSIINKINVAKRSANFNKSFNISFISTMPPKRKQTSQEDSTKSAKNKIVAEPPSRPKRNRTVTSYNEDYSDEPLKATKAKVKNAGDVKEKKVDSGEVKVKGKRGRKKKVVQPEPEDVQEEEVEVKKGKNKEEVVEETEEDDDEDEDDAEVAIVEDKPKKNGKAAAKKPAAAAAAAPKNKTATDFEAINFDECTRKNENGKEWNLKISNWNVGGIRSWINKGGLDYVQHEKPDIFCLQEVKCSEDKLPAEAKEIDGYKAYWLCSDKDGYAGVGLYSKQEPVSVEYGLNDKEHDNEGRVITAEFDKFYVVNVYVPNSGRGLVTLPKRLKWNEAFRKYVAELDKKKPVIVCGDMNVSHLEIDLSNPKTNTKNAGFTKEERDGMTDFLSDGYVDTFRKIYPDKTQAYTFWTYMSNCRAKNIGWRLDYFIVSERFMDNICDNIIRNEVFGSDHCPLTLFLNV